MGNKGKRTGEPLGVLFFWGKIGEEKEKRRRKY